MIPAFIHRDAIVGGIENRTVICQECHITKIYIIHIVTIATGFLVYITYV